MSDEEFQAKVYQSLNDITNAASSITGGQDNHMCAIAIMNEAQALIRALKERANARDSVEET